MKKSSIIIIVIVSIFTAFLAFNYFYEKNDIINLDGIKFKNEYEKFNNKVNSNNGKIYPEVKISSKNMVKYSSYDEIIEVLKSGTGVIYLGYPECPWCRNLVPILLEAAIETEIPDLYYLNIKEDRDVLSLDENNNIVVQKEGKKEYYELLNALDTILNEYVLNGEDGTKINSGEKRIYVPTVVFVKDGKIVGHHFDTVESQTDPYTPLNDRQKDELFIKLVNYCSVVSGSICDESC